MRLVNPKIALDDALKVLLKDPDLSFFKSLNKGTKRLAILAHTEPKLAILLEELLYNGSNKLGTKLGKSGATTGSIALDAATKTELLRVLREVDVSDLSKSLLGSTRGKIVKEINEVLGKNLDIDDVRKLDDIISEQGSRGSVFEHWLRHNKPGHLSGLYGKKTVTGMHAGKKISADLDAHYLDDAVIVAVEMKNIIKNGKLSSTGHQGEQLRRYVQLVRLGSLKRVEYVFSKNTAAEASLSQIATAFLGLPKGKVKVFYIDALGDIHKLKKMSIDKLFHLSFVLGDFQEKPIDVLEVLLKTLDESILPQPECLGTETPGYDIDFYLHPLVSKAIEENYMVEIENRKETMKVTFTTIDGVNLLISIEDLDNFSLSIDQLKSVFTSLVKAVSPKIAFASHYKVSQKLYDDFYENNPRTDMAPGLEWLQYYGVEEYLLQGGKAILDNPNIDAELLEEGILIQVGNDPFAGFTSEGEDLFVKATNAMPPVSE